MVAISTPYQFSYSLHGTCENREAAKGNITSRQRRRASKNSRHGWQADPITRWKWANCSAGGFGCCSSIRVPELFRDLFTISNRKSPHRLVACLAAEPEGNETVEKRDGMNGSAAVKFGGHGSYLVFRIAVPA
jgi:hypothetical protein